MDFVDFNEPAARAAVATCTEAAAVLTGLAQRLAGAANGTLGAWQGASRIAFADRAGAIATDLRSEAARLDATAGAVARAIAVARAENERRRRAYLERLREAEQRASAGGPR